MRGYFKSQWCMLAIYSISLSVLFVSPYEDEENNSGGGCRAYKDKCNEKNIACCEGLCCVYSVCQPLESDLKWGKRRPHPTIVEDRRSQSKSILVNSTALFKLDSTSRGQSNYGKR